MSIGENGRICQEKSQQSIWRLRDTQSLDTRVLIMQDYASNGSFRLGNVSAIRLRRLRLGLSQEPVDNLQSKQSAREKAAFGFYFSVRSRVRRSTSRLLMIFLVS